MPKDSVAIFNPMKMYGSTPIIKPCSYPQSKTSMLALIYGSTKVVYIKFTERSVPLIGCHAIGIFFKIFFKIFLARSAQNTPNMTFRSVQLMAFFIKDIKYDAQRLLIY